MNHTQKLEHQLEQLQHMVKCGEALTRLEANQDYKLIIGDALLAQTIVGLIQKHKLQPSGIEAELNMIGAIHEYLHTISVEAASAPANILDVEAELERVRGAL